MLTVLSRYHLLCFLLVCLSCGLPNEQDESRPDPLQGSFTHLPGDRKQGQLLALHLCQGCHIVEGKGRQLSGAPSFADSMRESRMTSQYLRAWLTNPAAIRPGTQMPVLGLSKEEISHLIAYLEGYRTGPEKTSR